MGFRIEPRKLLITALTTVTVILIVKHIHEYNRDQYTEFYNSPIVMTTEIKNTNQLQYIDKKISHSGSGYISQSEPGSLLQSASGSFTTTPDVGPDIENSNIGDENIQLEYATQTTTQQQDHTVIADVDKSVLRLTSNKHTDQLDPAQVKPAMDKADSRYQLVNEKNDENNVDLRKDKKARDLLSTAGQPCIERRHVYFLKVHKTGSTTMRNILQRFALKRNLTQPILRAAHSYPSPDLIKYTIPINTYWKYYQEIGGDSTALNSTMKEYLMNGLPEDMKVNENQLNIFDQHSVLNKQQAVRYFPANVSFVCTLRNPLEQLMSACLQWHLPSKLGIPGDGLKEKMEEFLKKPEKYDKQLPASTYNVIAKIEELELSYTRNYVAYEFGFDTKRVEFDEKYISDHLRVINETFKAVIFTDRYAESLIILKHELCWTFQDILFIQLRKREYSNDSRVFDDHVIARHRNWTFVDYKIYDIFLNRHEEVVRQGGTEFRKELLEFEHVLEEVTDFCFDKIVPLLEDGSLSRQDLENRYIIINQSKYSEEFTVDGVDCVIMTLPEAKMHSAVRAQKYPQLCDEDFIAFLSLLGVNKRIPRSECYLQPRDTLRYSLSMNRVKEAFWKV